MKKLILAILILLPFLAGAQTTSFTVSKDTLCRDSCITLINTSTGTADSIRWYIHGISLTSPHSDTINVCFTAASEDTAWLYVFRSGITDTAQHIFLVKPSPHPMLTFNIANCRMRVPGIYSSYQWYNSFGSIITGATSDSLTALMNYFYVVVDSNGCLGHSDTLAGCAEGFVPITKSHDPSITIFPNPVINNLSISISPGLSKGASKISQITITNLLGQTLLTRIYNSEQVEVNVVDLPAGVYLVKINSSEIRKFVKE